MTVAELLRPAPGLAWVDEGSRVVALRLADLRAHPVALEDSAAAIWRCLRVEGSDIESLVLEIATLYEVEPDIVRTDVTNFLQDALASGLLERSGP